MHESLAQAARAAYVGGAAKKPGQMTMSLERRPGLFACERSPCPYLALPRDVPHDVPHGHARHDDVLRPDLQAVPSCSGHHIQEAAGGQNHGESDENRHREDEDGHHEWSEDDHRREAEDNHHKEGEDRTGNRAHDHEETYDAGSSRAHLHDKDTQRTRSRAQDTHADHEYTHVRARAHTHDQDSCKGMGGTAQGKDKNSLVVQAVQEGRVDQVAQQGRAFQGAGQRTQQGLGGQQDQEGSQPVALK